MIIKIDNNYKPQPRKSVSLKKSNVNSSESFEDIVFSSAIRNEKIEEISKKLDDIERKLEREFSSQIVEEYKELIRDLIKKLNSLANVIEKSSSRSKDKKLKVIVFADGKLKEILEKMVKEHISKAILMSISTELKGIIMSILA